MRALKFDPKEIATLDKVLHEPARLSVVACLALVDEVDFVFLQSQTGMTGGNLSSHIRKLESSGYISVQKEFQDGKPRTSLKLTATGQQALTAYLHLTRKLLSLLDDR